jgi:cytochrome c peroxidase
VENSTEELAGENIERVSGPRTLFAFIALLSVLAGCGDRQYGVTLSAGSEKPIGEAIEIKPPLGLPPVPIPGGNPETAETIALGRKLFYDKRLSSDQSVACASCHNPLLGFTDGRRQSLGVHGRVGTRNAPTVVNAAYLPLQFWDGRAPTLEAQAEGPIANPIEMDQGHDIWISNLDADPAYRVAFAKAFGPGAATIGKVEKAIAGFERTLISGNSPFDRYQFGGDRHALSPAAIRGLKVFLNPQKGNCAACHTIGSKYALFTDGQFHNTGAGVNGEGDITDLGRFVQSKRDSDKGAFMTPTLRNIAASAPYMHDGSLKTLKDVVDFYAGGGNSNPYLDKQMKSIHLTGPERADLVAFLESLTGDTPPDAGPPETVQARVAK